MPLVNIVPNSDSVEEALAARMGELRARVKAVICGISGFPSHDVLVNLLRCPMRDADPDSADLVLFADTCPHEELEARSDLLCEQVAMELSAMGFSAGNGAEVWPRFLPGPWCLVRDGQIVDRVFHPRE